MGRLSPIAGEVSRLNVQVVGLGFVGLTLAVFLSRKTAVLGVEISEDKRNLVSAGASPFFEPHLEAELSRAVQSLSLRVSDKPESSPTPTVFFLTVGTPIKNGVVDLGYLTGVVEEVAAVAKDEDLVIVRSTVSIGTTRNLVWSKLRALGLETRVAMAPERTIEGTALAELQDLPQIIGGMDKESSELARDFFIHHGVKTVMVDSPEAAELAKLAANTFRDLQFAFANELAMLGDCMGVNVRQVISAANLDYPRSRIAMPGPAAGPCLEKDPWILSNSGESVGASMLISRASRTINEMLPRSSVDTFLRGINGLPDRPRILLAGLAFKGKPETDDTRGSLAFSILDRLKQMIPHGLFFTLDPLVSPRDLKLGSSIHLTELHKELPFDVLVVQHSGSTLLKLLVDSVDLFRDAWTLDYWGDFEAATRGELESGKLKVFGGSRDYGF